MAVDATKDVITETRILAIPVESPMLECVLELQQSNKARIDRKPCAEVIAKPDVLDDFSAVIITTRGGDIGIKRLVGRLVREINERDIMCLIVGDDAKLKGQCLQETGKIIPKVQWCPATVSSEELYGRLCMLLDYRPAFEQIERHLAQLEEWTASLNTRFDEIHQELRLAWRVQQDFLPKQLPNDERFHFAALYRPASWVSGDIYDIFRLDERHIGFFVADVVGHGVAAGLMTLFVKRSLVTKEITNNAYKLVPPGMSLSRLNSELCDLQLPEQQFVTSCYALLDTETLEMTVARGGHPFPMILSPSGDLTCVKSSGPLLGVFHESQYPEERVQLERGSKVVFITDGLPDAFGRDGSGEEKVMAHLRQMGASSAEEIVESFNGILDCEESSLNAIDDITMVVAEVLDGS